MEGNSSKSFLKNIGLPALSERKVIKHKKYKVNKFNDESLKNGTLSSCGLKILEREQKDI
jgi:hypothetical protein